MDCPLLRGKHNRRCGGIKIMVVLSTGELERYCTGGNYTRCPVYNTWITRNEMLGITEYHVISSLARENNKVDGG